MSKSMKFILLAGVMSLAVASPVQAADSGFAAEKAPARLVPLIAGPAGPPTLVEPEARPRAARAARAVTIQVTYHGFPTAAKTSFQRAVDIWASILSSSVPITVDATFEDLGDRNRLGQAGPSFVWRDFKGAPQSNTWFPDTLANKLHGKQIDPSPDIVAQFNSTFPNWHFDSSPAPGNKYDFETVVLHELGHGLGFLGGGNVSGGRGSVRLAGFPTVYDLRTEDQSGKKLLVRSDNSTALGNALVSGNIFYDSRRVRKAFEQPARLFAPNPFKPGSSYSHLDEATFPAGNANSLMTPYLGKGETIRNPGPIVEAILKDEGWN